MNDSRILLCAGLLAASSGAAEAQTLMPHGATITGGPVTIGSSGLPQSLTVYGGVTSTVLDAGTTGSNANTLYLNSGGVTMLQMGGSAGNIKTETDILLGGTQGTLTWGTGPLANNQAPIHESATFAGSITANTIVEGLSLVQTDTGVLTNSTGNTTPGYGNDFGIYEQMTENGASALGGRGAAIFQLAIKQTGETTNQWQYTAMLAKGELFTTVPAGGCPTNTGSCTLASIIFGEDIVSHVGSGVTAQGLAVSELDSWSQGATLGGRTDFAIVDIGPPSPGVYGQQAAGVDDAFSINNNYEQGSTYTVSGTLYTAPGFRTLIDFGKNGTSGHYPGDPHGTMISAEDDVGGVPSAFQTGVGVDFHYGTCTGAGWLLMGSVFKVDCSGVITGSSAAISTLTVNGDALLNSTSALGTAATAGFVHLPYTAGAPTGTPTNTTPGCEINQTSHNINCNIGGAWYHYAAVSGAG